MSVLKYKDKDGNWQTLGGVMAKQINVVQTTGTSIDDVMSQNAVSELLNDKSDTGHTHVASDITDLGTMAKENKTSYSSATEVSNALSNKVDKVSGKGLSTNDFTTTEKTNLDSLATNIATISGITSSKVSDWDTAATNSHSHSNKEALDAITGSVGTMAYENKTSYSSATEVNTALGGKADTATTITGYGITDAKIENQVITLGSDSITVSSATQVNTALGYKADKADAVVSAVTVSSDLSNVTCPNSITGASKSGAQAIVIYENGGTTTDYTITVSTNYKSPDGSQISITCAKGGYCEVSYINVNGTIYARGA